MKLFTSTHLPSVLPQRRRGKVIPKREDETEIERKHERRLGL